MQSYEQLEKYRIAIPPSVFRGQLQQPTPPPGQDGFFYIPNFISEDEERYLLDKINHAPQPKWKNLQNRRLQYWGGQVSAKNVLLPETLPEWMTGFPPLVGRIAETGAFSGSKHAEPNHCLVNEYHPGQGIMPHEDGTAYFPAVATISLESHSLLDIYRWAVEKDENGMEIPQKESTEAGSQSKVRAREQEPIFSILQEPRSLLITVGSAYKNFLHGIADRTRDETKHLTRVANVNQLQDSELKLKISKAIMSSAPLSVTEMPEVLPRETRVSMTFRDVEKVSKGVASLLSKR